MNAPLHHTLSDALDLRGLVLRRETLLAAALAVLLAGIALRFPAFVTPSSLGGVFNDSAILIIMALGQTAVLLTRSVDLSVAARTRMPARPRWSTVSASTAPAPNATASSASARMPSHPGARARAPFAMPPDSRLPARPKAMHR